MDMTSKIGHDFQNWTQNSLPIHFPFLWFYLFLHISDFHDWQLTSTTGSCLQRLARSQKYRPQPTTTTTITIFNSNTATTTTTTTITKQAKPTKTKTTTMHPEIFFNEGMKMVRGMRKQGHRQRMLHSDLAKFNSYFGTYPCVCSDLWRRVDPKESIHPKSLAVHLLWTLLLLHSYSTEAYIESQTGVCPDTVRYWTKQWISGISFLSCDIIDWENRFSGNWHYLTFCVDGIDCPIDEPRRPWWRGWLSQKFKHAGVAYEIATAVTTGQIIWINGPFPAGTWHDVTKFKLGGLASMVRRDIEKGVGDSGYRGAEKWLSMPYWRYKCNSHKNLPRIDIHA